MLIQIAEEFVDSTLHASCQNAKHRKSNTVEAKDVQLYLGRALIFCSVLVLIDERCLERTYSMWIPGFGTEDPKTYKKFLSNDTLKAVSLWLTRAVPLMISSSRWKRLTSLRRRLVKVQLANKHRLNDSVFCRFPVFILLRMTKQIKSCIYLSRYARRIDSCCQCQITLADFSSSSSLTMSFDHFSDLMNLTGVKLTVTGVFFLSTFLCSTLPICLFSWVKTRSQASRFSLSTLISCVTCFGGGIFLGASLLDLLPEVIHHINLTMEKELQLAHLSSKRYPIAELLIGLGIFLVLFLEQSILSCQSLFTRPTGPPTKKPTIIMTHDDDEETTLSQMDDQDPLIITAHRQFEMSEQKDDLKSSRNRLILTRNSILLLSLIIHSVFEGIALGSTSEEKSFYELFFAIIIHKSIIAFSVGLKLMSLSNKRLLYCACALLSIATPLGIFFVVTMQELLPHNRTATIIHEILRAFACGTFFYITFFDILPHELNISSHHRHSSSSSSSSMLKVLFIFLGFAFIALLSFGMKWRRSLINVYTRSLMFDRD